MCSIGGFVVGKNGRFDKWVFLSILKHMDLRGRDSFGVVYNNPSELNRSTHKLVFSDFNEMVALLENAKLDDYRFISMTGRAIPAAERVMGTINSERDSQPFVDQKIIAAHNGLLSNDDELRKEYGITTLSPVDTAVIPPLVSRNGMDEVLKLLKGSYALSVIDENHNRVHLATNFMPLYYYFQDNVLYWASDPIQLPQGKQLDYYSCLSWGWKHTSHPYTITLPNNLDLKKVLVICSGGLDSVTTLKLYKVLGYDVKMVHFLYGQKAEFVEDWSTEKIAKLVDVERIALDVKDLFRNTIPSVLLGNKKVDLDRHLDMQSSLSYVGCRNLLFTTITIALAERLGAGKVSLGLNLDDSVYSDNNITFLRELTKTSACAMDNGNRVQVTAPFVHLTKKEIIEIAIKIGSPLEYQVSCYYPELHNEKIVGCGACGCDKLREFSFKALHTIDPVEYKKSIDWADCTSLYDQNPEYEAHVRSNALMPLEGIPYRNYLFL